MTASTKQWARAETEVAAPVIEYLREAGWDVYQEVEGPSGRCIDIVARKGPVLWALEAKRSLNLSVLDQAYDSLPYAHKVSAVVPRGGPESTEGYEFGLKAAAKFGIGVLEVWPPEATPRVVQAVEPEARVSVKGNLAGLLAPAQKLFVAAGSAGATHWTPFKATSLRLRALVGKRPGILMTEAVKAIEHHYSSDANAAVELRRAIETGIIEGLRIERVNEKRVKIWPALVGGAKPLTLAEQSALRLAEQGRHTAHPKKR